MEIAGGRLGDVITFVNDFVSLFDFPCCVGSLVASVFLYGSSGGVEWRERERERCNVVIFYMAEFVC